MAARFRADDDLAQLASHLLSSQQASCQSMMEVADFSALVGQVAHDRGGRQQLRLDFLLFGAVCADRGDEGAG